MNLIGSPRPGLKKNLKNWPAAALSFLRQRPLPRPADFCYKQRPHRACRVHLALIETKGLVSTLDVDFLDHVVV
jgi:hypothetical protein